MSSASSVPAAQELVDQMICEGGEVEQTLQRFATTSYSSLTSDGIWQTHDAFRQIIMCHPKFPNMISLFYSCKKLSAEADTVKVYIL